MLQFNNKMYLHIYDILIVRMNLVLMNIKLLNHFDINFRNKECNFLHC